MKSLDWYFDFISPYAYLQNAVLARVAQHAQIRRRPILFGGLLTHWGHLGPAEIPPKRDWTYVHCAWLAEQHGIALRRRRCIRSIRCRCCGCRSRSATPRRR